MTANCPKLHLTAETLRRLDVAMRDAIGDRSRGLPGSCACSGGEPCNGSRRTCP